MSFFQEKKAIFFGGGGRGRGGEGGTEMHFGFVEAITCSALIRKCIKEG